MQTRRLGLLLAIAFVCGCGSNVRISPLLKEFAAYERDAGRLALSPPASEFLAEARAKREAADPLVAKGKDAEASPVLEKAVADARVSLAASQAEAAGREADSCRLELDRILRLYRDAVIVLRETEKSAGSPPHSLPPEPPALAEGTIGLPPSLLTGAEPPELTAEQLQANWEVLARAASKAGLSLAGLTARFEERIDLARDPKTPERDRPLNLYLAARALQEAEGVTRARLAERDCRESGARIAALADAHDLALRATLEMERDMKDALRAEARDRQQELYDALHQLEGKYAHIQKTARGTILSLADILFDFDKATLKRDVEFNLVKVATILNQFAEMNIAVEGHTDNIGTPEYNLDLSQRRAQAVHDFLVSQDVAPSRMTVAGYGLTRPVADNATEEGRQRNRRVDLVIQDRP